MDDVLAMPVVTLYDWHSTGEVLQTIRELQIERDKQGLPHYRKDNKLGDIREAWVISKFCAMVFPQNRCEVRLCREAFPDACVRILESGYEKYFEITQAFKGGELVLNQQNSANHIEDYLEYEHIFIDGLKQAIDKKVVKYYDGDVHLLIYIRNIPTWGAFQQFLDQHKEEFEMYRKKFLSVSVLSTRALTSVQILPKFKVFTYDD